MQRTAISSLIGGRARGGNPPPPPLETTFSTHTAAPTHLSAIGMHRDLRRIRSPSPQASARLRLHLPRTSVRSLSTSAPASMMSEWPITPWAVVLTCRRTQQEHSPGPFAHGRPGGLEAMSASYREEMWRRLHIRILLSRLSDGGLICRTAPGPAQHRFLHRLLVGSPRRIGWSRPMGDHALKTQL
jgi:hypothetical protein